MGWCGVSSVECCGDERLHRTNNVGGGVGTHFPFPARKMAGNFDVCIVCIVGISNKYFPLF